MLCLSIKVGQSIIIGDDITVKVMRVKNGGTSVQLAIDAPRNVPVWRSELLKKQREEADRDENSQ